MSLAQPHWVELLKYPVAIFSILVAIIAAKYSLGIEFGGPVSEISKDGIKFYQDAKGEIASLASKLNGALVAIEELQKRSNVSPKDSSKIKAVISAAEQTVSDQTAQLSSYSSKSSTQKGYIWIGNYDNEWSNAKLASLDTGQEITIEPKLLRPGTSYQVLGNMVVRDGLPANDVDYYRGRKSLGTIPRGTIIRLVSTPVGINREFAIQYWAQVELQ